MPFPLFLRGFVITLVVFAIANYAITHSLFTTIINTVICAVLVQVGYFAVILLMVWRSGAPNKNSADSKDQESTLAEDGKPKGKAAPVQAAPLPGVGRSPLR